MMSAFAANNQRCQVEAVPQNGPDPKRELIEPPPATDDPDYEIALQFTNLPKVNREVTALFEWFGFSDLTVPIKGLFEDTLRKSGADQSPTTPRRRLVQQCQSPPGRIVGPGQPGGVIQIGDYCH